jgi:hypothetical protein
MIERGNSVKCVNSTGTNLWQGNFYFVEDVNTYLDRVKIGSLWYSSNRFINASAPVAKAWPSLDTSPVKASAPTPSFEERFVTEVTDMIQYRVDQDELEYPEDDDFCRALLDLADNLGYQIETERKVEVVATKR